MCKTDGQRVGGVNETATLRHMGFGSVLLPLLGVTSSHLSTDSLVITGEKNSFNDKDAKPKLLGSLETGILEGEEETRWK